MRFCVLILALALSSAANAETSTAVDELRVQRNAPPLVDTIEFLRPPGERMMAWEVVKQGRLVYLNYSRFPFGQDSAAWGMAPAQLCYEHVAGHNYIGISDSIEHLRRAMHWAIADDGHRSRCMVCGPFRDVTNDWPGGLILPAYEGDHDVPHCPLEPIS